MPLPPIHRRKISETTKNKLTTKNGIHDKSNSHESIDTSKKSHASNSMNTNRKPDTDKSQYSDAQEKGFGESYVHELKDFAGVTIILRSAPNQRNFDGYGKGGSRRKSELQQSQLNMLDKYEHEDKTDHSGANSTIFTTKSEVSTNNSNETSGNDH